MIVLCLSREYHPNLTKLRVKKRSTPAGQHRPVLLQEVLHFLAPQPGDVVVDCTLGWAGHAVEFLRKVESSGKLIGIDLDSHHLQTSQSKLAEIGFPFSLTAGNFAGLKRILAEDQFDLADLIFADLGVSSMQIDDANRGFSYRRDGPLDMRMSQERGRTAAQLLANISESDLTNALSELGDEPDAAKIAKTIIEARTRKPIETTRELAEIVMSATWDRRNEKAWQLHPSKGKWTIHPAARTFQALRILVNRELANLEQLLRELPNLLRPGGRVGIIAFHSGEDRLVKHAFKTGLQTGPYDEISPEPIRATWSEKNDNPRSRSAKLRWARRAK